MTQVTFSILSSGDDGSATGSLTAYPPVVATSSSTTDANLGPEKTFLTPNYTIAVALLRFDTSSLPDSAVVLSALLRLYVTGRASADGRDVTGEWYEAGTIDTGDWTNTVSTSAHSGTLVTSLSLNADYDFQLNDATPNISLSGYTGLRLHVSGGQPTGTNYMNFASWDDPVANPPRLVVNYVDAGMPSSSASLIAGRGAV